MNKYAQSSFLYLWLWMLLPLILTGNFQEQNGNTTCEIFNKQQVLTISIKSDPPSKLEVNCYSNNLTFDVSQQIINQCKFESGVADVNFRQCSVFNVSFSNFFQALNIAPRKIKMFESPLNIHHEPYPLENLTSVRDLELINITFNKLPTFFFRGMNTMNSLKLINNSLTSLANKLFESTPSLTYFLQITDNNFTSLDSEFRFPNLLRLNLSGNNLRNIPKQVFTNIRKTVTLWLNNNNIQYLDEGIFDNFGKLDTLDLSRNNFTRLPNNLFQKTVDLRTLYLNDNELESLNDTIFHKLNQLKILHLSSAFSTNTSTLPDNSFLKCNKLEVIMLANNSLHTLSRNIFKNTKSLKELDLSGNQLIVLNNTEFDSLGSLQKLNLARNRLDNISGYVCTTYYSPD